MPRISTAPRLRQPAPSAAGRAADAGRTNRPDRADARRRGRRRRRRARAGPRGSRAAAAGTIVAPLDHRDPTLVEQLREAEVEHLGEVLEAVHVEVVERRGAPRTAAIVNVGLVMGSMTPSAAPKPWANAVLPAPRSPASRMTSPGRRQWPGRRPGAGCRRPTWAQTAISVTGRLPAAGTCLARTRSARICAAAAAATQHVRRVQGRHELPVAEGVHRPPQLRDAVGGAEQQAGRHVAEGHDDRRVDELELAVEVAATRRRSRRAGGRGCPAAGTSRRWRCTPRAGQPQLLGQEAVQELAGPADEGHAEAVLLGARPLPHDHHVGVRRQPVPNTTSCDPRQAAPGAGAHGHGELGEGGGHDEMLVVGRPPGSPVPPPAPPAYGRGRSGRRRFRWRRTPGHRRRRRCGEGRGRGPCRRAPPWAASRHPTLSRRALVAMSPMVVFFR